MKILFLPTSYTSPSARFRLWQFIAPLRESGHEVVVKVPSPTRDWEPKISPDWLKKVAWKMGSLRRFLSVLWLTRDIKKYDVVMMNRDLLPGIHFSSIEPWLIRRNPRFVFDFDDSIHLGSRKEKLKRILPAFALITPGNPYLAEFASTLNKNVRIWPTVINTKKFQPIIEREPGPIRIGWTGSKSTRIAYLPLLEELITLLALSEEFEFIIIADEAPEINWPNVKSRFIRWTPETEVAGLQQIDIGLMPLRDEPFDRGKCGAKAILYMGIGIPALVSPVGVNSNIVEHGKNGFHCRSEDDWLKYLKILIHDNELRTKMGQAARQRVLDCYSIQSLLPEMVREFQKVALIRN